MKNLETQAAQPQGGNPENVTRAARRPVAGAREVVKWQNKLLPFMIIVLSTLTLFFFTASALQIYYLHNRIERSPLLDLNPALGGLETTRPDVSDRERLDMARWKTLSILEGNALQRRYHQANVLLMSRIWTGYLGFVTGMILALVGATFILGKMRESETKLDGGGEAFKFSMTTASPGLVLALLGTILMITTMVSHYDIRVNDGQLYTSGYFSPGASATSDQGEATSNPPTFPPEKDDEEIDTGGRTATDQKQAPAQRGK
ncbi:hypothetical protein BH18ACI4_BH18ACI4_17250 [soil metagenome]